MRFEEVCTFLLSKLENELPAGLNYHNVHHTQDVLAATIELAASEKVSDYDLELL